jgi:hypothetical protein
MPEIVPTTLTFMDVEATHHLFVDCEKIVGDLKPSRASAAALITDICPVCRGRFKGEKPARITT